MIKSFAGNLNISGGQSFNLPPASNKFQRQLTSSPVPVVGEEIEGKSLKKDLIKNIFWAIL